MTPDTPKRPKQRFGFLQQKKCFPDPSNCMKMKFRKNTIDDSISPVKVKLRVTSQSYGSAT